MPEQNNTNTITVSPLQVDFQGRLSIIQLCDLFLETASLHADAIGFGIQEMQERQSAWVLTRILFHIARDIKVFETVKIETWIHDVAPAFTTRKFNLYDKKSGIAASASTTWMLIDLKTRRPRPLEKEVPAQLIQPNRSCLTGQPDKIDKSPGNGRSVEYQVKYSDIDIQKHVNSGKYIQWIMDQFPKEQFLNYDLFELQLNYLSECHFGDQLLISTGKSSPDLFLLEVTKEEAPVCRAMVLWKRKSDKSFNGELTF